MNKLSNLLSSMSILTEANEDDLFDIDKEVDAQIKRVTNRLERKRQQSEAMNQEDQQEEEIDNSQDQEEQEQQEVEAEPEDDVQDSDINQENDNTDDVSDQSQETENQDSGNYEYMDNGSDTVPENYEAKQTIPELRILSTLSDSEYALCNIKIMEQFKELQSNAESSINNILMNITTRNARQEQIVEIVHENLHDMIQDISTYILYRNNDIYEENVRTYLTYLKRYDIAMKLVKSILEENKNNNLIN